MLMILFVVLGLESSGQRRITPVEPSQAIGSVVEKRDTTRKVDKSRLAHYHDADGNVVLVDTVTGKEYVDTVEVKKKEDAGVEYPLFYALDLGVDVWDPLMRAFGQKYGLFSVSAGLSLHNRFRPILEIGLGNASYTPDDGNFTYKGKVAPYFKLGVDYNILYKSDPTYEAFCGVRFGLTPFSYEITDVMMDSGYWNEETRFNIPSQSVTASYMELVLGIKVKVWRDMALGWTVKYHSLFSDGKPSYGKPWYIPGFGTRGSNWAGAFSVYYTIPLNKPKVPVVETNNPTPIAEPVAPEVSGSGGATSQN